MKVLAIVLVFSLLIVGSLLAVTQQASAADEWAPKKTITLLVPWGSGGASD